MLSTSRFIHGVFAFEGRGFDTPHSFGTKASYAVAPDKRAQLIYFRAGNSSPELVNLSLLRDGKVMRHFPIGAKSSVHVPLAVVEDLSPETKLEVVLAAPEKSSGFVVIDVGLIEID
jgi:hypothetical protein